VNSASFKNSSRSRPLKLSMKAVCIGFPGATHHTRVAYVFSQEDVWRTDLSPDCQIAAARAPSYQQVTATFGQVEDLGESEFLRALNSLNTRAVEDPYR
jgi:hypothetical protein